MRTMRVRGLPCLKNNLASGLRRGKNTVNLPRNHTPLAPFLSFDKVTELISDRERGVLCIEEELLSITSWPDGWKHNPYILQAD